MSEGHRDAVLTELNNRVTALRDMMAILLALQARASADSDAVFREVSAGLDDRLAALNVTEPRLVPHIERIRTEFDWIIAAARASLGSV